MNIPLIFLWVYLAMIANSFWEAYVEGCHPWDKRKVGWKKDFFGVFLLTGYHFWLFFVMWPVLLLLPMIIFGWDLKLFGVLGSAYFSGLVLEDFTWFLVNPEVNFKRDFGPEFVHYFHWTKIGRLNIPINYLVAIAIAILFWVFLWR